MNCACVCVCERVKVNVSVLKYPERGLMALMCFGVSFGEWFLIIYTISVIAIELLRFFHFLFCQLW